MSELYSVTRCEHGEIEEHCFHGDGYVRRGDDACSEGFCPGGAMEEVVVGSAAEFGQKFVWCVEHERPVDTCRQLAMEDYGQPSFDNCQWISGAELETL